MGNGSQFVLPAARVKAAHEFGKVAVLFGGHSAERAVSLKSGTAVLGALKARGVTVHGIDAGPDVVVRLTEGGYHRVFIALHGKGGEDGALQGALETLGIPYTGSGVLGSALGMDKLRAKELWRGAGLPTPPFTVLDEGFDAARVVAEVGLPLIVKPICQGSSIGMTRVEREADLLAAYHAARRFDARVMAERWISGAEYTAAILLGQSLPLIKLETPRSFYDYEAKYSANDTRYLCPCGLDSAQEKSIQRVALRAFESLGCSGWGRVDIMCDSDGRPWLLEVNTVPGMTDHSLVPMAAHAIGLSFEELCWRILETSMELH
jgi:D-alanine-D-alanine ligase